ncbi:unnamed protein product [Cunninghamella blakesleeana]
MKHSELQTEMNTLETQIKEMESELMNMKNGVKVEMNNIRHKGKMNSTLFQQQQQQKGQDHQVTTVTKINNKPLFWNLKMTKEQLSFETNVKTLGEFLHHLQNLNQIIHCNNSIPTFVEQNEHKSALLRYLSLMLLKKHEKVRYKTALMAIEYQDWNHDQCSVDFSVSSHSSPSPSPSPMTMDDHFILFSELSPPLTATSSPLPFKKENNSPSPPSLTTTFLLVKKYTECQHLYQFAIHLPTFYRYFEHVDINTRQEHDYTELSPALTSFCAVLCTFDCDHIRHLIPEHHLHYYGHFYFEHAKNAISERFDEVSLELLTSYVFMAIYQWNTHFEKESLFYADLANRLATVLSSEFDEKEKHHQHHQHCNSDMDDKDDTIHFYRILSYLAHNFMYQQQGSEFEQSCQIRDLQQLIHRLNETKKNHSYFDQEEIHDPLDMNLNDHDDNVGYPSLSPNYFISKQLESHFLQYHTYRHELQLMIKLDRQNYHKNCASLMEMMIYLTFMIEDRSMRWYNGLDEKYRFTTLSLFDSAVSVTDTDYFDILNNKECEKDIIPALMTLSIYDECLLMGLSALPKRQFTELELNLSSTLSQFWDGSKNGLDDSAAEKLGLDKEKWKRRFVKMNKMRMEIDKQDMLTDEEFLDLVVDSLYSSENQRYNYPFIYHSFLAAINTIRISYFLLYRRRLLGTCCYFDKRLVINAKTLLSRLLLGESALDPSIRQYEPMIREKILFCDKMIHLNLSNPTNIDF